MTTDIQPASVRHVTVTRSLRTRARWRRRFGMAVLLAFPASSVLVLDACNRGNRMLAFDPRDLAAYVLAASLSFGLWTSLLILATARNGARNVAAVGGSLLAGLLLGGQDYAYDQYFIYMNFDAARLGDAVKSSVLNQLGADGFNLASHVAPAVLLAAAASVLGRRLISVRRSQRLLAQISLPASVIAMLVVPCSYQRLQAATPDVLFMHAVGATTAMRIGLTQDAWTEPMHRRPVYLPALRAEPPVPRNVVLVIDESIRADVTCMEYDPSCEVTRFSNEAAPRRVPFRQLRSHDSATLVSIGVLFSGLSPLVSNDDRAKSPLLFDIAHAAGVQTAYVTSQNLDFANCRVLVKDLPLDLFAEARDLVKDPDIDLGAPDMLTSMKAIDFARRLPEPFLLVVQYANVHYPFLVNPERSPFQPSAITKDPDRGEEFFNHYKNAVHLHDEATAALIRGIRELPSGDRTVILYTSDHGEAFREHDQYGHTMSVFDEEVHVPGWIDAPAGSLTERERAQLERARDAYTWHADFAPTVLDLLGLWDAPELGKARSAMLGNSLLRGLTTSAVPITNCTEQWGCAFRNWGMMRDGMKLEARAWDADWHCYDVRRDPGETRDLGPGACAALGVEAMRLYGQKPGD